MVRVEASERRFHVSINPQCVTALPLHALLEEHRRWLPVRSDVMRFLFDGPARRFVWTRHAFQRESTRLSVEQQLMTAQAANELAQPRRDIGPIRGGAGGTGTHEIPPDRIAHQHVQRRNASEVPTDPRAASIS